MTDPKKKPTINPPVVDERPDNWKRLTEEEQSVWLLEKCTSRINAYPEGHTERLKIENQIEKCKKILAV